MSNDPFDLAGKRAFITGASRGIGIALARGLPANGAEIVLNGRDAAKLTMRVFGYGRSVAGPVAHLAKETA